MNQVVVLASRNLGKLKEMQALFASLGWALRPVSDFSAHEPEETEHTFAGNALIKARYAAQISGLPAIADDSGLCVEALGGAPGVETAYYAGKPSNDAANNQKLLRELANTADEDRSAEFVCVMAYVRGADDSPPVISQAKWRGRILREPRGANGFGYDPLFYVPTQGCSSAELPREVKNRISHRGQAAAQLLQKIISLPPAGRD